MKATVIVSTYNGAEKLPGLLEALLAQTMKDFELLVVVDGSVDNSAEVLRLYENRFKSFRAVFQKNGGRANVRNRGMREATAELLIFYDDDMLPPPSAIERHLEVHRDEVDKFVTGNPIELEGVTEPDVQNYKANRAKGWIAKYKEPLTKLDDTNLFFTAAICSVKKSLLIKLNGFDERLKDAEDFDLGRRAMKMGYPVLFDRDNIAVHRDRNTAQRYVLRQRQYRKAHEQLRQLYPELKKDPGGSSTSMKAWIYGMFQSGSWIKWIDAGYFKFIPRSFRYKMYDVIFHALSVEFPESKLRT